MLECLNQLGWQIALLMRVSVREIWHTAHWDRNYHGSWDCSPGSPHRAHFCELVKVHVLLFVAYSGTEDQQDERCSTLHPISSKVPLALPIGSLEYQNG